jgi:hypothetical protein
MGIELHGAYVWDCDACGRENFTRGLAPCLSDDEAQELREEHGIEPHETGNWTLRPESVTCAHCGSEFEVDLPEETEP